MPVIAFKFTLSVLSVREDGGYLRNNISLAPRQVGTRWAMILIVVNHETRQEVLNNIITRSGANARRRQQGEFLLDTFEKQFRIILPLVFYSYHKSKTMNAKMNES
jgi:ABC-type multidrug transport system permease subunit